MRTSAVLALVLTSIPLGTLRAQCPDWATGFFPPGVNGTLNALGVYDSGGGPALYVGGSFTLAGGEPRSNLARWDGASWSDVGGGVDNFVSALLAFDDRLGAGRQLYAGGAFGSAGGLSVLNIARWNGSAWSDVGAGMNDLVLAFASYDDGTGQALYAGGLFTSSGTTPCAHVAKWTGTAWAPLGSGVNAVIEALCVFDDGNGAQLYAGGEFTSAGGAPASFIARWNGTSWSSVGSGMDNPVYALKVFQDAGAPRLFAGGNFSTAGGVPALYVARWNGTSWSSLGFTFPNTVYALEVHDDGGGPALFTGSAVGPLANASAPRIHRYAAGTVTALSETSGAQTYALLSLPAALDGANALAAGGRIGYLNDLESSGIAVRAGSTWSALGPGGTPAIYPSVFQVFDGGSGTGPRLYIGGYGSAASPYRSALAIWDGQSFHYAQPPLRPRDVLELAVVDAGTGPRLYVSAEVGGSYHALQAFDGTSWSLVDFAPYSAYAPYSAMVAYDDGSGTALYAGGSGAPPASIGRWSGAGWIPLGAGLDLPVTDLLVWRENGGPPVLIAGGYFSTSGSTPLPSRVARWDGTSWSPIGASLTTDHVICMALYDSGAGEELYAGGQRVNAGIFTHFVARWDGAVWVDIASSLGPVTDLVAFDDGSGGGAELYVFGQFTSIGGVFVQQAAKWNGARWAPVDAGFDNVPRGAGVVRDADGVLDLWIGGTFRSAGGHASYWVARLDGCGPVSAFCAGDNVDPHVTTDCPCGNFGGAGHGCAWHNGPQGALLAGSGSTNPDALVLTASHLPLSAPSTIFFQGDALASAGVAFGDGVRCAGGHLIRLGTTTNVNGVAQYPDAGDAPVSVRGSVTPGSGAVRYYQTYYRNAAMFCTPATFNVTNGVRAVW